MKLAIDIDGCLANFTDSYSRALTEHTGISFPKNSDEWPTEWYWDRAAGITKDQEKHVWNNVILAKGSTFWQDLDMIDGADKVIKQLNSMAKRGYDVYYLTHRMGDNAKGQTEKWLYERGCDYPTVVMTGNKLPVLVALDIGFFVDDKTETIQEVGAQGVVKETYLKLAPYNRGFEYPKHVKKAKSVEDAMRRADLWV